MVPLIIPDPNIAFLVLAIGLGAVFWEAHTRGLFMPGIVGTVLIALAGLSLYSFEPGWQGAALIVVAIGVLVLQLRPQVKMPVRALAGIVGAILLTLGAVLLFAEPNRIPPLVAGSISAVLGLVAIFLGYRAMRALQQSMMTGEDCMCRECAIAETDIDPDGTVLVRGEHWRAHSEYPIRRGARVHIRQVYGMVLFVEIP